MTMKMILKKNQVIISVIAIMLIAAGYMNYTTNEKQLLETSALTDTEKYAGIGDATLVSANAVENNEAVNNESNNSENIAKDENETKNSESEDSGASNLVNNLTNESIKQDEIDASSSVVETSSGDQYFAELRLERDKMYSQMLESYQKILSNSQISETQKEISENEIKKINDTRNAIMIAENLILAKGIENVVIFANENSVSVIAKAETLEPEKIAQIQNIVSRELEVGAEIISISTK